MAAEFPVGFSCRETGTPPDRRLPVCCCRGGKAGFHRVLQQSFIINTTPRPRGIIFTPEETSVFAVISANGRLITGTSSVFPLELFQGGYVTCFSSQKSFANSTLGVLSFVFGQTLFSRRALSERRTASCFW